MNFKRVAAIFIAAVLLLSFTGCRIRFSVFPDIEQELQSPKPTHNTSEDADSAFADFMQDEFIETISSDTISLHFKVADPEA